MNFKFINIFLSATVVGVRFDHFNVVNIHQDSGYLYVESRHFGCDEVNISNHTRPADVHKSNMLKLLLAVKSPVRLTRLLMREQVVLAGLEG